MAVYRGIVRNNVVVPSGDVTLPEGTSVEIVVPPAPASSRDERQLLRARGLLTDAAPSSSESHDLLANRRPITVRGRLLSEQIIDERR